MDKLISVLKKFKRKKILILGDILADEYIYGETSRLSREAPVLILKYDRRIILPGGAGNCANNISALGASSYLIGVIGDDREGKELLNVLKSHNVDVSGIVQDKNECTTVKTRIMAGGHHTSRQQVIRIDKERKSKITLSVEAKLLNKIKEIINKIDAIIISDYDQQGVLTQNIREQVLHLAKTKKKTVVVDSRYNILEFSGATVLTPSESELAQALGVTLDNDNKEIEKAGRLLLNKTNPQAVLVTRGSLGMSLFEKNGKIMHIPVCGTDEVADVTGAGDTVTSVFTLALASHLTFSEAAKLSNYAGGIVVMKRGTATANTDELKEIIWSGGKRQTIVKKLHAKKT
ncbi:MAG: PfkB family carbohydrate kinase [Candidatus Firestonebacteria bacterium]